MSELTKGAELVLEVSDLNNLGYGVAHAPDGRVVFLGGAVAGDTVRAQIIKVSKTFVVGKVTELLAASPDRVDGYCGAPASCLYGRKVYSLQLVGSIIFLQRPS